MFSLFNPIFLGFGWAYEGSGSSTSPKSRDKNKQCDRLTRIVNKLQCTKVSEIFQSRCFSLNLVTKIFFSLIVFPILDALPE